MEGGTWAAGGGGAHTPRGSCCYIEHAADGPSSRLPGDSTERPNEGLHGPGGAVTEHPDVPPRPGFNVYSVGHTKNPPRELYHFGESRVAVQLKGEWGLDCAWSEEATREEL